MTDSETPRPTTAAVTEPFGALHDLQCPVTVVLGTGSVTVRRFLGLTADSVVPLREATGEDLELHVNGVLLAKGEVVVVEDHTSFRVTTVDVVSRAGG